MFVIGTDTFLVSPLLPTLTDYYGISTSLSGFMVSSYALGYMLSALVVGPFSDQYDRKKILVGGLIIFTLATTACGLANTFLLMLFTRFIAGVAAASAGPQIWAAIPILFPKNQVVKTMGYATSGLAIAQIIGVPLGSYLAAWSWRFPFFFVGSIALVLTVLVINYMPDLNGIAVKPRSANVYREVSKNKAVLKLLFSYLLFQTANFCGFSFIGTWFAKSFSLPVASIGSFILIIGAGQFIGSLLASRLVQALSLPRAFLLEFLLFAGGYLILPFSPSALVATTILAFIYLIGGAIFPLFMTTLQSQAGNARGTISSLANAAMYFGEAIGGVLGGILIKNFAGFFGVAAFTIIGVILAMLLYARQGYFRKERNKAG
ncbi:permease of the major facilitator superfamily protein [Liquorilactobacillus sucicola DSM 21376 = JCM 15457]|uniref:Permease of the major facilitator superfamily protein n=2 Tax=Liquorilactobacillus sucicola TaxID=519050 RepID=A0A0R2DYW4_9LACO|nr:permease of the major facilitator superfamily protein [Liquorilactobacillus sucicola DSM 21376 = JCM 15457]